MGEIITLKNSTDEHIEILKTESELLEITKNILLDTRIDISKVNTISMPIAELGILGAGVSSLIPALRTVTQTATVSRAKVNSILEDIQKKFKYYRLSLYTFAMASLIEIMLSGNFKEENIAGIMSETEKLSMDYRDEFTQCSVYLEKLNMSSVETNVLKKVGTASKAVGKFIGGIPVVKEGPVDEFLQDKGIRLKKNAEEMERDILVFFAQISDPGTGVFMDKMKDMIQIYNRTSEICFDEKRIYLIAG